MIRRCGDRLYATLRNAMESLVEILGKKTGTPPSADVLPVGEVWHVA